MNVAVNNVASYTSFVKKIYISGIIAVVLLTTTWAVWLARPVAIFGKDLPFVATLVQPTESYKRNNLYKLHISKRAGDTPLDSIMVSVLVVHGSDGKVYKRGFFVVKSEDVEIGKTYVVPKGTPPLHPEMVPYDWTFQEYDTVVISHTEFNPIVIKCVKGGSVQIK